MAGFILDLYDPGLLHPHPSNFVPILLELAVGNSRQTTTDPRRGDVDRSSKQLERVKGGRMGEDQLLGR